MPVSKDTGWKDAIKAGRITEPGCSFEYETGGWRTFRPVHIPENCINCLFCWIYCPDMAIKVEDGKFAGIDYAHCKGCGVCATECPGKRGNKALVMELNDQHPTK